jgi:hypothetical protein
MRFDQTKTTAGNISSRGGRQPFTANAVMVNTASLNAQSDINVRADLTGQVKVEFRSETFPLERFADSAAIQLINSHARVPEPRPTAPGATPGTPAAGAPAAGTPAAGGPTQAVVSAPPVAGAPPPATPATPAPASPNAPASQSLATLDPWAPRVKGVLQ